MASCPPDLQQLALVVFFLPSISANTLFALGVVTRGNLHWWPCSYKHWRIYCMCRLQLALCGGGGGGGGGGG